MLLQRAQEEVGCCLLLLLLLLLQLRCPLAPVCFTTAVALSVLPCRTPCHSREVRGTASSSKKAKATQHRSFSGCAAIGRQNCMFCRSNAVLFFQDPAKDGKQAAAEIFGNSAHYRQRSDAHDKSKHGKAGQVRCGCPKVRPVGVQPWTSKLRGKGDFLSLFGSHRCAQGWRVTENI